MLKSGYKGSSYIVLVERLGVHYATIFCLIQRFEETKITIAAIDMVGLEERHQSMVVLFYYVVRDNDLKQREISK